MHRDIKAANIMMDSDMDGNPIAKLGDLNVSKVA
jgi:serine/threonine protein kinase